MPIHGIVVKCEPKEKIQIYTVTEDEAAYQGDGTMWFKVNAASADQAIEWVKALLFVDEEAGANYSLSVETEYNTPFEGIIL